MENRTEIKVTEFILIGFPNNLSTRLIIFILVLLMYLFTLLGNIILISTVVWSPQMHTPMYYLLCNLALLDLLYSSSNVPKMLIDTFYVEGRISFGGCAIQMCAGLFLGQTECLILAVMAFDRYVAICHPMRYTVIMSWKICKSITVIAWLVSFLFVIIPTISTPAVFCRGNKIDHFACEVLAVLKLACGDSSSSEASIFYLSLLTNFTPFVFIVVSYGCIIISVLKIRSVTGRSKAFSTCVSHLIVVLLFYGTTLTMYLGPTGTFLSNQEMYIAVVYAVLTPMLNPLIYSLRNKEVKTAVRKLLNQNPSSWTVH